MYYPQLSQATTIAQSSFNCEQINFTKEASDYKYDNLRKKQFFKEYSLKQKR